MPPIQAQRPRSGSSAGPATGSRFVGGSPSAVAGFGVGLEASIAGRGIAWRSPGRLLGLISRDSSGTWWRCRGFPDEGISPCPCPATPGTSGRSGSSGLAGKLPRQDAPRSIASARDGPKVLASLRVQEIEVLQGFGFHLRSFCRPPSRSRDKRGLSLCLYPLLYMSLGYQRACRLLAALSNCTTSKNPLPISGLRASGISETGQRSRNARLLGIGVDDRFRVLSCEQPEHRC
jgi:hypothetical protein